MITETIKKRIIVAMKAKDEIRLSTLKLLSSELYNAKIEKQEDLNEKEEIAIVRREAKKRRDAIEAYKKAEAFERAEKEEKELKILQEFLPKDMSEEELIKIVDETVTETGAKSLQEMGRVIGVVMGKVKGQADGGKIAEMVKTKLT